MSGPAPVDVSALVAEHLPLVTHLITDMSSRLPGHVDRDELVSAGMLGLLQAARAFDPDRGVGFGAFARNRIRGALLDELRSRDWATRSVRGLARQAGSATEALTAALHRTPTAAEVAGELGVDVGTVTQLSADVERATVLHYESIVLGGDAEGVLGVAGTDPESHLVARERCHYLNDAVASLPSRMRSVVVGLFFEDRTGAELAAELGVTEARISQIRSEALALLREGMEAHLESPSADAAPTSGAVAKRKAAYFAAVASASDYRSRLSPSTDEAAERVAVAGL